MARWKVDIWTTDWAFEWWINSIPKGQRSCRGRSQKNIQGRWGWEGIIKIWQYFKGWTKRKNSDVDASYYFFLQWFGLFYVLSSLSVSSLFLLFAVSSSLALSLSSSDILTHIYVHSYSFTLSLYRSTSHLYSFYLYLSLTISSSLSACFPLLSHFVFLSPRFPLSFYFSPPHFLIFLTLSWL